MIFREVAGKRVKYEYDAEHRLIGIRQDAKQVRYHYDGLGNRAAREVDGKLTHYLNHIDAGFEQVMAEYDSSGQVKTHYLCAGAVLGEQTARGETRYYLEDHLNSIRRVIDERGETVARFDYSPFGEPLEKSGEGQSRFGFAGEVWDGDAGLLYLRNRYYDPGVGRFLSKDLFDGILTNPQSLNRYVYAENDPINLIDPSGLTPQQPPFFTPPWMPDHTRWPMPLPRKLPDPNPQKKSAPAPVPTPDPERHRPRFVEAQQKWWEDLAVRALTQNPHGFKGKAIAGISSFEYAVLEYYGKRIETPLRKLADPQYTTGHPWRTLGAGFEFAWNLMDLNPVSIKDPRAIAMKFGKGIDFTERFKLLTAGNRWAQRRTYLPFIDPVYRSSKTLRFTLDKPYDLYDALSKASDQSSAARCSRQNRITSRTAAARRA